MPGWFLVALLVSGAVFVVEAGLSLARGRAVVPALGKRHRSTLDFWTQLLTGIVFLLAAVLALQPAARGPATVGIVLFTLGAMVGLVLGIRSDIRHIGRQERIRRAP